MASLVRRVPAVWALLLLAALGVAFGLPANTGHRAWTEVENRDPIAGYLLGPGGQQAVLSRQPDVQLSVAGKSSGSGKLLRLRPHAGRSATGAGVRRPAPFGAGHPATHPVGSASFRRRAPPAAAAH